MLNKIDIPGTSITLEIVDKNITITNKIEYDMQMHFRNTDADASLTTSGISLIFAASRESSNEKSDLIVRHFNYCDRMGLI